MKKFYVFFVLLIINILGMVYANGLELFYDGEYRAYTGPDVTLILNGEKFVPSEGQIPPIIIENRTLVPVREVFEKLGGTVVWDGTERSVEVELEGKSIKLWIDKTSALIDGQEDVMDVPAKIISNKTMVPVRFVSEKALLLVDWDGETHTVTINKDIQETSITAVKTDILDGVEYVSISCSNAVKEFDSFYLSEPDRVIIDINNSVFALKNDPHNFSSSLLEQIRFGDQGNNVNRIVLDLKQKTDYTVAQSEDETKIYIAFASSFVVPDESEGVDAPDDNDNDNQADEPNNDDNSTDVPDDSDSVVSYESTITGLKFSSSSDTIKLIYSGDFLKYEMKEEQNPKKYIFDIENALLAVDGPTTITPTNKAVKNIYISQFNSSTVRLEVLVTDAAKYELDLNKGEFKIKVEQPEYWNVEYENLGENAKITLRNVELSDLSLKQIKSSGSYTISYSSNDFSTGKGTINVKDDFVKKISITNTKITIKDEKNMKYVAEQVENDVVITISKNQNNITILLDAGHGGTDPGAINGEHKEKTYNLAILLKLKDILEEEGYTVYTTREEDVTLTVNDRVELATEEYPEASLYISIHNNSVTNKNYTGTLIMYCPRDTSDYGITSKELAQYVLDELIDNLGTVNRGFISVAETDTSKRVLTEVPMPSILCEVAFVSNDEEAQRLSTDEFQESAAIAIFNGIEKALEQMS